MFDFIRRVDERMDLMRRMAQTAGAPLPETLSDGRMSGDGLRSAAFRCASCTSVEACKDWLDEHADAVQAAPSYCRNRGLFELLSGRT
jgi:hypothetical protein